ncbi:hypothetical protein ACFMBG_14835 [Leisingera sp. D0M16]|uniref:hypothetical protein n=1 Tax=Leisingera coralii TaxID=3351347 RepID=UPI003B77F227
MPWTETDEHNKALYLALTQLAAEKGALERLAGAITDDERAQATARARKGIKHKDKKTLVAGSTLVRWQEEGLAYVSNAQSHKKRIVFEFLERSPEFKTELFRPEGQLPQGLLSYAAANGRRLAQPFDKELSKLDGVFELYRPAWTTPERSDRVLVSRLKFSTEGGFTRFREEQDYIDPDYQDAQIHEIDEGGVMFTAANIIMFGLGANAERVKFFVADNWQDALNGPLPVIRLSGMMMGISGRRHHPSFPFVALRSSKPYT